MSGPYPDNGRDAYEDMCAFYDFEEKRTVAKQQSEIVVAAQRVAKLEAAKVKIKKQLDLIDLDIEAARLTLRQLAGDDV